MNAREEFKKGQAHLRLAYKHFLNMSKALESTEEQEVEEELQSMQQQQIPQKKGLFNLKRKPEEEQLRSFKI